MVYFLNYCAARKKKYDWHFIRRRQWQKCCIPQSFEIINTAIGLVIRDILIFQDAIPEKPSEVTLVASK
jgi:hypothetical protein